MVNDPYAQLGEAPAMRVTLPFPDGDRLPLAQVAAAQGGEELSPRITWEAVEGAGSYLVSCFDPDAPTMSGFWHWIVYDIPASTTVLEAGAGSPGGSLPRGAKAGLNDAFVRSYIGAVPPYGHGEHRYFFTVTALDTASIDAPSELSGAFLHFMAREHVIARGHVHGVWRNPSG